MPDVTIVIPTYNRAHIITRAIISILKQTYQNFEIIIVDDGSTDNTSDVIEAFHDERIIYTRQTPNQGVAAARNTGIRMAKGKYIAFQDSDDESLPDRIELQVKIMDNTDCTVGIVYSDMLRVHKNGKKSILKSPKIGVESGLLYPRCLNYMFENIGIGSSMIRAECFSKVGLLDVDLHFYEELEFFIRASKYYYFHHINRILLNYYEEDDSNSRYHKIIEARKVILNKYFVDIKKDNKYHSIHLFNIGNDLCYIGKMSEGLKFIREALVINPLSLKCYCGLLLAMFGSGPYHNIIDFKNKLMSV